MSLLPQIFTLFNRATCSYSLIQYPQIEALNRITALLDPNIFPIQDLSLKLHTSDSMTIWEKSKTQGVMKNLIFKPNLRESIIDHSNAGEGVFLETIQQIKGMLFQASFQTRSHVFYDDYQSYSKKTPSDMHFFRFNGPIFDFTTRIYCPYIPGQVQINTNKKYQKYNNYLLDLIDHKEISQKEAKNQYNERTQIIMLQVKKSITLQSMFNRYICTQELLNQGVDEIFGQLNISLQLQIFLQAAYVLEALQILKMEKNYFRLLEYCLFNMEIESPDWLIKPSPLHPQISKCNLRQEGLLMMMLEDYAFQQTKDVKTLTNSIRVVIIEDHQYL
ncbi:unnamed protein product [Paramecium octaurelia]|uniref:Uncharacterized protein n=1 Tax=Paramecium octaurelia TaxID=43137 RepID=A0A8S1Y0I6_PAROT|nr:unnamed protein product [Paramecium octaurelia]